MTDLPANPPARRRRHAAGRAAALERAVGAIYEAAADVTLWPTALRQVIDFVGNSGTHLVFIDEATGLINPDVYVGMPAEMMNEYNGDRVKSCPRIESARRFAKGEFCYDYQHIDERGIDHNEYYDWLQRQGDSIRYYLATQLDTYSGNEAWLSLAFRRSEGHSQGEHMRRFRSILPHVNRAIRIGQRLGTWELAAAGTLGALNALQLATFVLGTGDRVLQMNTQAEHLLSRSGVVRLLSGRLQLLDREADRRFAGFVHATRLDGDGLVTPGGALDVRSTVTGDTYRITVSPLRMQSAALAFAPTSAIVFIERVRMADPAPASLQQRFGLTPAEARIAEALVRGASAKAIARQQDLSVHTVRGYIKVLLQKTGTNRQAALVRRLLAP